MRTGLCGGDEDGEMSVGLFEILNLVNFVTVYSLAEI